MLICCFFAAELCYVHTKEKTVETEERIKGYLSMISQAQKDGFVRLTRAYVVFFCKKFNLTRCIHCSSEKMY